MTLSVKSQRRLEAEMNRLRAEGAAFAVATVVRTVDATSAKPGGKALLDAEGALIEGWVGGGCARAAIGRAAREAIAQGRPQFVSLRPEELLEAEGVSAGEERDGIRFARNGCPSKGSMDVFVEPVLPQPRLVICGAGPVALALADLAARFDLHRMLCAPGAAPADLPEVEEVQDGFALDTEGAAQRFVVVATQGRGDEAALRAALASGADHVAFVGSRRKFATLAGRLAADGVDRAALDRVAAPAGLDIHAITPDEIALSILAQIVQWRRAGDRPKEGQNG
ncbi:XdhC/CoxI family protein [Actibacterium sp. MT2.3-13A]|uniref:XdhC family protein n=1 Tax=Actibacterium sp. MT2.3-13A TaxID=2828332 RepID=UPI001BAA99BF|nr:XdhC/CoxI family protein [Actibacterium sp. MT2.3-13A]